MRLLHLSLFLFLFLSACLPCSAAPTAATPAFSPTATTLAQPANATRTPEPGFTLLPSTPIAPTTTPIPCVNDAQFLNDVSVPDFTQLAPGAAIDKRWAVKNTGSCDWGRDYRLVFIEGNSMGAASEHALYPAKAGNEAVLQINMIAPDAPGDYSSRWQLRDPQGAAFGPVLFIKITVIAIATAQP